MAQADTEIKDIRIVSERGLVPSPTEVSEVRGDIKKMRLAEHKNRSPGMPGRGVGLNNEKTGGIAVAFSSPTVVSGSVDVGVTP